MGGRGRLLGIGFCAAWFAVAVTTLVALGARDWWRVVVSSAANGHHRFAAAGVLVMVLPVLLTAAWAWCWRRRGWLAYCLVAALAVLTPALVVPNLAHLVPPLGWIGLAALELLGLLSAYAVVERASTSEVSPRPPR